MHHLITQKHTIQPLYTDSYLRISFLSLSLQLQLVIVPTHTYFLSGSSMRPLVSVRSVERADSNTSAASASAFYSPYLRTSSESFSSDSSSGGDRMKLIQEQIKLMEKVMKVLAS